MVNVAPPHDSKSTHAVDVLDLDAVVEGLWRRLLTVTAGVTRLHYLLPTDTIIVTMTQHKRVCPDK